MMSTSPPAQTSKTLFRTVYFFSFYLDMSHSIQKGISMTTNVCDKFVAK
jgi:hypothetical protein